MAEVGDKRRLAAQRAAVIYGRLMALCRPDDFSNAEWLRRAGVNASFFTNLKNGSEPSVGNLRDVLEVVGVSLSEFFIHEARGRVILAQPKETPDANPCGHPTDRTNGQEAMRDERRPAGSGMAGVSRASQSDAGLHTAAH